MGEAIKDLFKKGTMSKQWDATKLVLLPKVLSPSTPVDFRPISFCNMIYKCISKLLCSRLKQVLPQVIDQSQGAFIKGRQLIYNVLLCQELAKGYSRKHISLRCMMKIDMKKAYDCVSWNYLTQLLDAYKFSPNFMTTLFL